MANQPEASLQRAREAIAIDPQIGAAYYLAGCSALRLGLFTNAVQFLQSAKQIDRTVNEVSYHLGRAHQQLGQWEAARQQFEEVVQFGPDHPSAWYNLSQVQVRLGHQEEARQSLENHQNLHQGQPSQITNPFVFEKCRYTEIDVPFQLVNPDAQGIPITFEDATPTAWAGLHESFRGPVGVFDPDRDGWPDLFVLETNQTFRFLRNHQGVFQPLGDPITSATNGPYRRILVGDMNNDRVEDVVVLGEAGSHLFKFATNGAFTDITQFSRARAVRGHDGLLVDLDFTGKLDLVALTGPTNGLRVYRNLGQPYLIDNTTNSGLPLTLTGVRQVAAEDWTRDDLLDLMVVRDGLPPEIFGKVRGGGLIATNLAEPWPATADRAQAADLNNDFELDLVSLGPDGITISMAGQQTPQRLGAAGHPWSGLQLLDYDNDGWLDIAACGKGLSLWRNRGQEGFVEQTKSLGLSAWNTESIRDLAAFDFDDDCDIDLLLVLESGGLKMLRNQGGNANHQLKLQLIGTKSNASGLGTRLEVSSGGLRLRRRVDQLPIAIGVGQSRRLDSLTVQWFDFDVGITDVSVDACTNLTLLEPQIRDGSCPYLYSWNGREFEFVTDILGASPLGLRLTDHRFVECHPFEYINLGGPGGFQPRDGYWAVQITEELREVLYLDQVQLVAVDHPRSTEVHSTSKLVPRRPFPEAGLKVLAHAQPLRHAWSGQGQDVTDQLREIDQVFVAPARLRESQLRGLSEPHQIILDFGAIDPAQPSILALTGWLRYGGGMANVAASHRDDLPFPFPSLEVRTAKGAWQTVDVVVGAPAGNTKTILADLTGKLPAGSGQLRLTAAFEIYWDRAALMREVTDPGIQQVRLDPGRTDLHGRGFSHYRHLPANHPLTPDYTSVHHTPPWRITPSGWATRYGEVNELVTGADNTLALVASGDELTVEFSATGVPEPPPGWDRTYYLYLVGWDKDADVHVETGDRIEPLPWHGMDDQRYGHEERPAFKNDSWMERSLTRWVGPRPWARR
jgi:hypothetical protein